MTQDDKTNVDPYLAIIWVAGSLLIFIYDDAAPSTFSLPAFAFMAVGAGLVAGLITVIKSKAIKAFPTLAGDGFLPAFLRSFLEYFIAGFCIVISYNFFFGS